jgi:hypothetical protein
VYSWYPTISNTRKCIIGAWSLWDMKQRNQSATKEWSWMYLST